MLDKVISAGKQLARNKILEFLAASNNFSTVLLEIKNGLENDFIFERFMEHIRKELVNFNYQDWDNRKISLVATKVVAILKLNAISIDEMPIDRMISIIEEISNGIKESILDINSNNDLLQSIDSRSELRVRESIAKGGDASKYIYLTIKEPEKTNMLPILLLAGVDPSVKITINTRPTEVLTCIAKISLASHFFQAVTGIETDPIFHDFNLLSYAVFRQNMAAVIHILSVTDNVPLYYKKRLEKTYDSALVMALEKYLNLKSSVALEIVLKLLSAGARLSNVSVRFIQEDNSILFGQVLNVMKLNNLQYIVKQDLDVLLKEILKTENKAESYCADMVEAMNYVSPERNNIGSALSIAIMEYYYSQDGAAHGMALDLIKAGAKLSIVKGADPYMLYNNLQLIIRYGFTDLLKEALNTQNKPSYYKADLLLALNYVSEHPKNSSRLTAVNIAELMLANTNEKKAKDKYNIFKTNLDLINEYLQNNILVQDQTHENEESDTEQSCHSEDNGPVSQGWGSFFRYITPSFLSENDDEVMLEAEINFEEAYQKWPQNN
ncbi:MAG: hypothetical protein M3R00_09855 [Pseudomonadota bacterium]|nr:hypothetical protein [Pseudomonadota bacterium]